MSIRKGGKRGTHGSLTKAGKVRDQTPQLQGIKRKKSSPIRSNKKAYKRLMRKEQVGNRRRRRREKKQILEINCYQKWRY